MRHRTACLFMIAALFVSCQGENFAEGRLMFRELLTLRDQIAKEFHEKVVDVSVSTNNRITVKFVDSSLNASSREEKQRRADAVATFVAEQYKRPVSSVAVQFVSGYGSVDVGTTYLGRPAPKK